MSDPGRLLKLNTTRLCASIEACQAAPLPLWFSPQSLLQ
jgi:hypothetical protein